MKQEEALAPWPPVLSSLDYKLAGIVAVGALAIYGRTLAPDILYGDSAEFQTLAYTLGMTHSTGYPVYLLIARIVGFLPLGTLAWRVNLLSALSAAGTLAGVFLLTRHLTCSRIGALLGSMALGISYTFWSQAVIAEVYTLALMLITIIMLLLWRWSSAPLTYPRALFFATLLLGLGLGVHFFVLLLAPTAFIFILWRVLRFSRLGQTDGLYPRPSANAAWSSANAGERSRVLGIAGVGLLIGVVGFLLAYLALDLNNPPTSFYQVGLYPSRSVWGLTAEDFDSPVERFILTFTGRQWQDAMFPGLRGPEAGLGFLLQELKRYGEGLLHEFSLCSLLLACLGPIVVHYPPLQRGGQEGGNRSCSAHPRKLWSAFVAVAFLLMLFFVLNYNPPDKYIFYLPTYIMIAVAIGTGAGFLLENLERLEAPIAYVAKVIGAVVLIIAIVWPFGASRWHALQTGAATFVQETYVYPVEDLEEPRRLATLRLGLLPDDAVLIARWRALYTMYYLAHVEQGRMDIKIMEAAPHGAEGQVADTLIAVLKEALQAGRPVYTEHIYDNLREHFRIMPAPGGEMYRLSLP